MLPAPAQGAIMVVCRSEDEYALKICTPLNDSVTETCVNAERDFLKKLMGGCTTPISALAKIENGSISFDGSLLTADGKQKETVHIKQPVEDGSDIGKKAAEIILASQMGKSILNSFRNGQ
jgi:hydroxymethylbilane synthase